MSIKEKLMNIQVELKANKSRYNKFGDYYHRNLEDIYEGIKPLLLKYKATLTVDTELFPLGDRIFRKAVATLQDVESDEKVSNTTTIQESLEKKGMSSEQSSGASQAYCVKYCLNLLFCLDDSKDADSMDNTEKKEKKEDTKKVGTVPSFKKNNNATWE
jgi:hypothetical protein